jgi:hypothetical protein
LWLQQLPDRGLIILEDINGHIFNIFRFSDGVE